MNGKNRNTFLAVKLILLSILSTFVCVSGDTPLKAMHPSFELINFRPPELKPQVTGFGWLSNGDLVFSHWNGVQSLVHTRQDSGMVYIMKGTGGDNPQNVTYKVFAKKLEDVLGMIVINDSIYISGGTTLTRLIDTDKDGVADKFDTIWHDEKPRGRHEFFFGLVEQQGKIYGLLSSQKDGNVINPNRGTWIVIDIKTKKMEVLAAGLREPNGINIGPDGEFFSPDVQGNWLPSCKLNHLVKGRFYGYRSNIPSGWENLPDAAPAIYLPQIDMCRSPSNPLVLREGPYKGQMIMGDVSYGGLSRIFLEKVGGEYQGCVFDFAGGLESGMEKIAYGPDGMIYLGGMGSMGGWWAWDSPLKSWTLFGLQKIKPTAKTVFEMKAVRSKGSTTLEIEFTEPAGVGAAIASNYAVSTWHFTPTVNYGGPPIDSQPLPVISVNLSADKMKATLTFTKLVEKYLVYIKLANGIKSATGGAPWVNRTYYTLNKFGPGVDVTSPVRSPDSNQKKVAARFNAVYGVNQLILPDKTAFELSLFNLQGLRITTFKGFGNLIVQATPTMPNGIYTISGKVGGARFAQKLLLK